MAENKLQKAANEIVNWTKENGFKISVEKTKAMLIHMRKSRVYERPKLKVRLGPNAIEMVRQHRI
jgi:tRNA nucleotidyltransferase (CCA-adding enzyme)